MGINYGLKVTGSTLAISDKWRRTRGHNNENVAGVIDVTAFAEHANDDGIIPSGVAVFRDEDAVVDGIKSPKYSPFTADSGKPLAGFISDMTGIDTKDAGIVENLAAVTVAIRETIVPKYLPVEEQRTAVETAETTGDFVFIKE